MDNTNTSQLNGGIARRTVVKGAAWSLPVIAASTAVPMATASGVVGEITFSNPYYGWPDTTASRRTAKYANGVKVAVTDDAGKPVPDGTLVTITIGKFDKNALFLFDNPTLPIGEHGETVSGQLSSITLLTKEGTVNLDGYLRRGSNAEHAHKAQTIVATVSFGGKTKVATAYWATGSSNAWFGADDEETTGPKDQAQNWRRGGRDWF